MKLKAKHKPIILIGISGASGSGKTTIANTLAESFGSERSYILSLDHFYRDLSHMSLQQRDLKNFDQPQAINEVALLETLLKLKSGQATEIPQYDFATHTVRPETRIIEPKPIIIIEGIFALSFPDVRKLLTFSAFVTCPEDIYLSRRIERDTRERGRSKESVIQQCKATVLPAYKLHIEPQAQFADIQVDGTEPAERSAERIKEVLM